MFESHRGHGCLCVVSVAFCQVEVSSTSLSLAQRSPTDCDASLCVIKKPQNEEAIASFGPQRHREKNKNLNIFIIVFLWVEVGWREV